MKKGTFLALTLGLLLAGCTNYNVKYDYDSRANYTTFKTFDWYAASRMGKDKDRTVDNPIMDRRVAAAVEQELATRGFRRETTADPDFLVTYYPVYQEKRYRTSQHMGWGSWGFRPFGIGLSTTTSQEHVYKEGTLVLEIVDFKTNQLVWKAAAEGALTELRTPEDADEVVNRTVHRMLERFPPTKP
jgi:hypothetical protein